MKKISFRLIPALSSIVLLGASAATLAAPLRPPEVATRKVRVVDLDLSTAAGVETLYGRIKLAARVVCRGETIIAAEYACRARAVENAVNDAGSPLLTSVHHSATGRTEEVVAR